MATSRVPMTILPSLPLVCTPVRSLPPEMRTMDSSTLVASACGSSVASSPVSTSPVTSLARSTLVGRFAGSIMAAGAMELPPESVACEPMSVSSSPRAPARRMPYIGLCGLLPVSFSERAAMEAPLVSACVMGVVRSSMPRRMAPSECQATPKAVLTKLLVVLAALGAFGTMSPGRPSLP